MAKLFWIPLTLGLGLFAIALGTPTAESLGLSKQDAMIIGAALIVIAGIWAWLLRKADRSSAGGGRGGTAFAKGGAEAEGGAGGRAGRLGGGEGGSAKATGNGSKATGGRGGDG